MAEVKQVVIKYKPRAPFLPYHDASQRYCLTVAHRRAGKTVARINKLIQRAAMSTMPSPRFGYLAPYFVQAKDIAWNYLKEYAAPIIELGGKVNESELSVTFPHNSAVIRLYGADNAERLRGLYFDGLVGDEAQDIKPSVLTSIILPALSDRKGWFDLSGTPKGWGNLLGATYKRAQSDPDWYVQVLRASETGLIDADELEQLRRSMPANEYEQEFECSFDAAISGAYFAREFADAEQQGRITNVPWEPQLQVHTAWDLGVSDSTTIWFYQQINQEIRLIDYYEASGFGLDHYVKVIKERPYVYGNHYAPHDIQVREFGTGKSRYETALSLGIRFDVVENIPIKDGIDAVRMAVPRMWIDKTKCAVGLDAVKQYREKRDEKRNIEFGPLHDWTSHAADSLRYLCVSMRDVVRPRVQEHYQVGWMG